MTLEKHINNIYELLFPHMLISSVIVNINLYRGYLIISRAREYPDFPIMHDLNPNDT